MLDKNSNHHGPSIVVGNSNKGRPEASLGTRDFAPMSIDELSRLHETVEAVLAKKIAAEIIALERCLQRLGPATDIVHPGSQKPSITPDAGRRRSPPVLPNDSHSPPPPD